MQRVNIDLPKELWRQVGIQAAMEDLDKRELVIKALEQYLNGIKNPLIKAYLEKKEQ